MTSVKVRVARIISAVPFLFFTVWVSRTMNLGYAVKQVPSTESGLVKWAGGQVEILKQFHHVNFLDELFRRIVVVFSPPTLGYDSIGSWQSFSFLIDLGPIYAIFILESYRSTNAWKPVYLATLYSLGAQLFTIGFVAPVYYFLHIAFGPTPSTIASLPAQRRTVWSKSSFPLLLAILLLHTSEVMLMFLPSDLATRHYWTWAWQMTPLWIGISNVILDLGLDLIQPKSSRSGSPSILLLVLGLISSGVWVYTFLFSPHSLSALFIPAAGSQSGFVLATRKVFQLDEVGYVVSTYAWLVYSFLDLYLAGLADGWLYYAVLLPVFGLLTGPGTAITVGWYLRERILAAAKKTE